MGIIINIFIRILLNNHLEMRRFCPPRMPRTCENNWSSCALRHMMCLLKNGAFIWLSRWGLSGGLPVYPMEKNTQQVVVVVGGGGQHKALEQKERGCFLKHS